MKSIFKFLLAVCLALPPIPAYAQEPEGEDIIVEEQEDSNMEETPEEEIIEPEAEETVSVKASNAAFAFQVIQPQTIECGKPLTFTLEATVPEEGGTLMYRFGGSTHAPVPGYITDTTLQEDPNKFQYQDSNTFEYTFLASGTYMLRFEVLWKPAAGSTYKNQYKIQTLTFNINDPQYPSVVDVAKSIAQECLNAGNTTTYEKALWLHDWVINHMEYDYSYTYCSEEGALIRGLGTCEAYTRGYNLLLKCLGIESKWVAGNGHCWSAVNIDGTWIQVDATWDDPGYTYKNIDLDHLYFGMDDALTTLVHSDHVADASSLSNTLLLHDYIQTGKIDYWNDLYKDELQANLNQGKTNFTINLTSSEAKLPEGYKKVIYNVLAAYMMDKNPGTTITYADNVLTVIAPAKTVAVTGISISKSTLALTVGDTNTLAAAITPSNAANKTITWTSSNSKVATVDNNGKVTAAAAGTATITVSTKDGNKSASCTVTVSAKRMTMHRLYNPNSGEHFYTASTVERDHLVKVGWKYEGVAWTAPSVSNTPVYRLYNPNAGDHHYTISAAERDALVKVGWKYEGIGWYSDDAKGTPLYRLYNPNAVAGAHHYTVSTVERDSLKKAGWKDEGIGWYGLK